MTIFDASALPTTAADDATGTNTEAQRRGLSAAYDAMDRLHHLAKRDALAGRVAPRDVVKRVWEGWQVAAQGAVGDGHEIGFVLRRGEEWVATTVRVTSRRLDAGAAAMSAAWESMPVKERVWRFDESIRGAVAAASFDGLLDRLCASIREERGTGYVEADLVALAMTTDHGVAETPLRFFLQVRKVLPVVDRAVARAAKLSAEREQRRAENETGVARWRPSRWRRRA